MGRSPATQQFRQYFSYLGMGLHLVEALECKAQTERPCSMEWFQTRRNCAIGVGADKDAEIAPVSLHGIHRHGYGKYRLYGLDCPHWQRECRTRSVDRLPGSGQDHA